MDHVVDTVDSATDAYCESCEEYIPRVPGYVWQSIRDRVDHHRRLKPTHDITLIGPDPEQELLYINGN